MDPLIDDNVTMAKRLKLLQVPMALNVLPGLPHAFLNFAHVRIRFSFSFFQFFKETSIFFFTSKSFQKMRVKVIDYVSHI